MPGLEAADPGYMDDTDRHSLCAPHAWTRAPRDTRRRSLSSAIAVSLPSLRRGKSTDTAEWLVAGTGSAAYVSVVELDY